MQQFKVMPFDVALLAIYPALYSLHDMTDEVSINLCRYKSCTVLIQSCATSHLVSETLIMAPLEQRKA